MKTPDELAAHWRATNNPAGSRRLARNWRFTAIAVFLVAIASFALDHNVIGAVILFFAHVFSKEASACSGWAGGYEVGQRHERERSVGP